MADRTLTIGRDIKLFSAGGRKRWIRYGFELTLTNAMGTTAQSLGVVAPSLLLLGGILSAECTAVTGAPGGNALFSFTQPNNVEGALQGEDLSSAATYALACAAHTMIRRYPWHLEGTTFFAVAPVAAGGVANETPLLCLKDTGLQMFIAHSAGVGVGTDATIKGYLELWGYDISQSPRQNRGD